MNDLQAGLLLMSIAIVTFGAIFGFRMSMEMAPISSSHVLAGIEVIILFVFFLGALMLEPVALAKNPSCVDYAFVVAIVGISATMGTSLLWRGFFTIIKGLMKKHDKLIITS